jgi:hypothetical protein
MRTVISTLKAGLKELYMAINTKAVQQTYSGFSKRYYTDLMQEIWKGNGLNFY